MAFAANLQKQVKTAERMPIALLVYASMISALILTPAPVDNVMTTTIAAVQAYSVGLTAFVAVHKQLAPETKIHCAQLLVYA